MTQPLFAVSFHWQGRHMTITVAANSGPAAEQIVRGLYPGSQVASVRRIG